MKKDFKGLSEKEVLASREKHGTNALSKEKSKGFFRQFFENLNDPIIKILIFALVIEVVFTLGKCNLFEVFGIVAAILIATTVSTASEYGSARAFLKMQAESLARRVQVIRDGKRCEIPSDDIVVGDVMIISAGEIIAADGTVLDGALRVDQSALNGESREVTKESGGIEGWELSNRGKVFRGSIAVSGSASVKVGKVGVSTYYGMVARDVQAQTRESPLKLRLAKFARQISRIGYVMAVFVAITYLFNTLIADNGFLPHRILATIRDLPTLFSILIHALTLMITVVVVAAPEGLPMMITVVLCANMRRMMRDGVLVKKPVGIETAGSLNILFTDKTGTLTTGKLECDKFILAYGTVKTHNSLKKHKPIYEYLLMNAVYNNEAEMSDGKVIGGNGTDRAIAELFADAHPPKREVMRRIPFTSERKYSSVTLDDGTVIIKGAPEIILSGCKSAMGADGELLPIRQGELEKAYESAATEGGRVIAVAIKRPSDSERIFLSLIVMRDKIRRKVRESVLGVKGAGVQVVMLTGDGRETAAAIAKECGILNSPSTDLVITSLELAKMSDDEVKEIIPRLAVLARALPQDKTRLVRLSQELDMVVGMTGDGINDAPSLKLSDVGFAMGNGADIAKSAGDVVLVDNSFFSINRTILYGRTIFKSIRKFITFQLIMNLTACGVSVVGQFLGVDSPITIIQMLWVNIIMDTLGGLAFSGEAPLEYYMKERPKRRTEPILSREMIHHIVFTGAYTLALCIAFLQLPFFSGLFRSSEGNICFLTAFYALFIFAGIFNCFGARCERMWIFSNISKNKPFMIIMAFISAIQLVMIYYGGAVFRTVPLTAREILAVVLTAFTVIPFEIIRRIFYKLRFRD